MSTIRWIHRRNKNCEKKIISLNDLKDIYSVDNVKEKNGKNSKSVYKKKIYEKEKSIKEKDKKSFSKFSDTKTRSEMNLKNDGIEKNITIYLNKKKINEKNGKENRRNYSSEVYSRIIKEDIEENKLNNYIILNNQNEEKENKNLNINLDINIQWDKNGNYEKNKGNNNDKNFLKNNINMKDLEDKMKNKYVNLYNKNNFIGISYLSDSFVQHDEKNIHNSKEKEQIYKEFNCDREKKNIYFNKGKLIYNCNEKEKKSYYCNTAENRGCHYDEEIYNYEEKYNNYDEKKLKHCDEKRQYIHYGEDDYQYDKKKKYNHYDEEKYNHYNEEKYNRYIEKKYNHYNEEKLNHYNKESKYDVYDAEKKYNYYDKNKKYNYCDEEKKYNYYDEDKKYNYCDEENKSYNNDIRKTNKDEHNKYYNNHNSDENKYYNTYCTDKENKYYNVPGQIEKKYYNKENKKYCNIEKEKKFYKDTRKQYNDYEEKRVYSHKELENFSYKYEVNKIDNSIKKEKNHTSIEDNLKNNFSKFSNNSSSDYIKKKNYTNILNDNQNIHNTLKRSNKYLTSYKKMDTIILSTNSLNQLFLHKVNTYFVFFKNSFLKNNRPIFKKYNKVWEKVIPIFKNKENLLAMNNIEENYKLDFNKEKKFLSVQEILKNNKDYNKEENILLNNLDKEKIKMEQPYSNILNKEENEAKILNPNIFDKKEQTKDKKMIHKDFNFTKNLYKNKVLNNTLIDSFNDVDLNDKKRKKKYLKFFVILLSLFLKKYMYKQFSKFFLIIGLLSRKHVEKRELRKYINIKIYSLSLLETILNKKKKEISMQFFNELKKKSINLKKVKEDEENDKLNFFKILKTKKYKSKNFFNNFCFGKPKLYGTDDFTIFYKNKILKEKDEIFQKCLLRSKSDSLLDFLKCSRINKFSKNFSKNFSDRINDDIKNSTLLERFYTATYNLNPNNLNKNIYKSKFHLSYYENINDTNFKYTNVQNRDSNNNTNKKKEIYTHFKKKDYETTSNNISSNSLLASTSEYYVDESTQINSFKDIDKKIENSSDEDINNKNCRIFFKNIKKKLKINYKKTVDINRKDEDLSLSDLNSTVDFSKSNKAHLFDNSLINLNDNSVTNLNFLTSSDLSLINNFPGNFSK
ncbi:conserved Plasmodium protein, unknown function [Plasmodium relictum]|uniref:Uncharacterized protein n=1 Tax=Plasmodium relictum TaxID=85471 RepID=A0A1J1H3N8_PLARL|nr:conserved Plasmodium protein, unknown function [Plasmodium relictum]CRG99335.1 conserved Plasmodium protein, unknown function [Plasmodium relictum]